MNKIFSNAYTDVLFIFDYSGKMKKHCFSASNFIIVDEKKFIL